MALFSKEMQSLDDLYMHTLKDIYYAENRIVKALPEMIEKRATGTFAAGSNITSKRPAATCNDWRRSLECSGRIRKGRSARR